MIDKVKKEKELEPVVFSAKYSNFVDVFNKAGAEILPEHTQHHLVIKTKNNQILSFSPIYDHSRLELEVLHEYIDEMLAKRFIVLSKSPLRAPILFTKKSDGGLRMCVDF